MDRTEHSSDIQKSRLQIVPWFNKTEWERTYQQTYSDDVDSQKSAYTQMCIWKARYPNLPLGVECTMSMLHVRLCDRQPSDALGPHTYKDRDLQLLYSTAVMRFLNQLTVMSNIRDSMYKMAERHQLPDWLINLRHEAAHGNSVPALYLLREAGDIIMQWLKENYWEVEADVMEDLVLDKEQEREEESRRITQLLHLWLQLKLHYWTGLKTIDRVPDEHTRSQAMQLAEEEGLGIKQTVEVETKKRSKKLKKNKESAADNEMVVDQETVQYTHKIRTAFEPLLRKLFNPFLKGKTHKKVQYQRDLIGCLVKYEGFCPQIDLDDLDRRTILQLMSLMGELWKEVVEGLQSHQLLHHLLSALVSKSADCQVSSAQLWLRLLCQLLAGQPLYHPPITLPAMQILAASLPCDIQPEVVMRRMNLLRFLKQHARPLELGPASAKDTEVLHQLAYSVLQNPTRFTSKYLLCLLSFWEPRLNKETKEKLCALAQIYSGQQPCMLRPVQVYTLASLLDHGVVIDQPEESKIVEAPADSSPWKLYSGDADWSKCALGALPW